MITFLIAGIIAGLWAADRVLIWWSCAGGFDHRLTPGARHRFGHACINVEELLQPSRRHVIEMKQDGQVHREEDDEGGEPPADDEKPAESDSNGLLISFHTKFIPPRAAPCLC